MRQLQGTYPRVNQSNDTALKYYLLSFQSDNLTTTDFKGPRYAANFYDSGFIMMTALGKIPIIP